MQNRNRNIGCWLYVLWKDEKEERLVVTLVFVIVCMSKVESSNVVLLDVEVDLVVFLVNEVIDVVVLDCSVSVLLFVTEIWNLVKFEANVDEVSNFVVEDLDVVDEVVDEYAIDCESGLVDVNLSLIPEVVVVGGMVTGFSGD